MKRGKFLAASIAASLAPLVPLPAVSAYDRILLYKNGKRDLDNVVCVTWLSTSKELGIWTRLNYVVRKVVESAAQFQDRIYPRLYEDTRNGYVGSYAEFPHVPDFLTPELLDESVDIEDLGQPAVRRVKEAIYVRREIIAVL